MLIVLLYIVATLESSRRSDAVYEERQLLMTLPHLCSDTGNQSLTGYHIFPFNSSAFPFASPFSSAAFPLASPATSFALPVSTPTASAALSLTSTTSRLV
jgi:hypothetical protein